MKKSYIAPSIKVESAKLAAFCSGVCDLTLEKWEKLEAIGMVGENVNITEGVCYCYHGVAVADFGYIIHNS